MKEVLKSNCSFCSGCYCHLSTSLLIKPQSKSKYQKNSCFKYSNSFNSGPNFKKPKVTLIQPFRVQLLSNCTHKSYKLRIRNWDHRIQVVKVTFRNVSNEYLESHWSTSSTIIFSGLWTDFFDSSPRAMRSKSSKLSWRNESYTFCKM